MTRADIDETRKNLEKYVKAFAFCSVEMKKLLPRLPSMTPQTYSTILKPDLDKIIFQLSNLLMDREIEETLIVKKYLRKEYDAYLTARREAAELRGKTEAAISKIK